MTGRMLMARTAGCSPLNSRVSFSSQSSAPISRGLSLTCVPGRPAIWLQEDQGSIAYFCPYHSWGNYEIRDLVVGERSLEQAGERGKVGCRIGHDGSGHGKA